MKETRQPCNHPVPDVDGIIECMQSAKPELITIEPEMVELSPDTQARFIPPKERKTMSTEATAPERKPLPPIPAIQTPDRQQPPAPAPAALSPEQIFRGLAGMLGMDALAKETEKAMQEIVKTNAELRATMTEVKQAKTEVDKEIKGLGEKIVSPGEVKELKEQLSARITENEKKDAALATLFKETMKQMETKIDKLASVITAINQATKI